MKFSLILCTINRTQEIIKLLESLTFQTYKNFEVIIIDQNSDNRIDRIINDFRTLDIKHFKSEIGLSRARNLGLKKHSGEIVCFPDDDCFYPPILLENINSFFRSENFEILMGKTINYETGEIVAGKNTLKKQKLSKYFALGSSTTLFIRGIKNNKFDENFGLGAKYGSEEENELVFRLLRKGYKGFYNPDINFVYHPPSDLDFNDLKRAQERSIGLGCFVGKHIKTKEGFYYFIKCLFFKYTLGSLYFLLKGDYIRTKYYFNKHIGSWKGLIMYFRENK